jgi:hypothetical protein
MTPLIQDQAKHLVFTEEDHKYVDENNLVYTSVTTLLDKYKSKFDVEFWSMYTGLKDAGYTIKPYPEDQAIRLGTVKFKLTDLKKENYYLQLQELTKAKWVVNSTEACIRGNTIHNSIELGINKTRNDIRAKDNELITYETNPFKTGKNIATMNDLDASHLKDEYPFIYNKLKPLVQAGATIFSEKRVYMSRYGIAGTIDCPIIKGKYFSILDWKSNAADMHDTPGYYKKERIGSEWVKSDTWIITDETFNAPISHIPASKFHTYCLQLSIYAYIMEQWGYVLIPNGLAIVHYPLNKEPVYIPVPYLRNEVIALFTDHKRKLSA